MKFIIIGNYSIFIKEMFFLIPQRPLESSKNVSTIASIKKTGYSCIAVALFGHFVQRCPRNITR